MDWSKTFYPSLNYPTAISREKVKKSIFATLKSLLKFNSHVYWLSIHSPELISNKRSPKNTQLPVKCIQNEHF